VLGSDGERSPSQVSKGMPMPGQNNDHSAPLDTAKSASSP
jgi:ribosomal protein L3